MTEHSAEQFDLAVERLLNGGEADVEQRDLLAICARLRELPRHEFQVNLKAELERTKAMPQTVTPFIILPEAARVTAFMEAAFGGRVTRRGEDDYAEVQLGAARVMLIGAAASVYGARRASLHYFVDDVDAAYQRAVAAGGKVLMGESGEPADRPYGERSAFVEDPAGNHWFLAKSLDPGVDRTGELVSYLYPRDARALIAFLAIVFGAQQEALHEAGGMVMHAAVKFGDSRVEMGEAEAFPQALFLYVDDPDATYRKALAAGATAVVEPGEHDGHRRAIIDDPWGNRWFAARRI